MRRLVLVMLIGLLEACGTDTPAEPKLLVNLGDSYSAGAGIFPLVEDSPAQCVRSSRNYAHMMAADKGFRLDDVSCSGADTSDFFNAQYFGVPPQLDAVSADASVVTMMIGGNDSDVYSGAISACSAVASSNPQGAPCRIEYGSRFVDTIENTTYPSLVKTFTAVRDKAPDAKVMVAGYPWILPPTTGCYPTMRVAAGDVPYLRDLQATLNKVLRRAAEETGVTFVDMSAASDGHDACQPQGTRWIEPQVDPVGAAAVHPNVLGQRAIAGQIGKLV
ncbi:SGNH/GDSL hydrolase family protein [Gordonia sp. CPCC 205515]|uniref:SGNH/GDSL hydrolase family protein n=1 Tax=Gordonia sp. CPCC 205515 TaxID=3140791 RepID=UPI003AF3DAC2